MDGEATGNQIFRRWWEKEKRFLYFDLNSFRNYYDSPVGGRVVCQRGDEIDRQLGPFQMFIGKYDKSGVMIFVGDYLAGPYGRDLIVYDDKTQSVQAKELDSDIYYSAIDVPFDESLVDGHYFNELEVVTRNY